jgi:hypothetical protein
MSNKHVISRIVARVLVYGKYVCEKCNKSQLGEGFEVSFDSCDTAGLESISDMPLKPSKMPFFWASNGNGRYACPDCNGHNRREGKASV